MTFELDENELEQFEKWKKQLPPFEADVLGEEYCFEYVFYPTGLGTVKKVRRVDGAELDMTNYDEW